MNDAAKRLVRDALAEDIGQECLTTNLTVPEGKRCEARLIAKQDGVLSGIKLFRYVFDQVDADVIHWEAMPDGASFSDGTLVASFNADIRAVLTGERTALNFLQRLSGVATLTSRFVAAVSGLNVKIVDTRKTTPVFRRLEKQAVVHGGGMNHRHTLSDGILIKENHIMAAGGITAAVAKAAEGCHHLMRIEVEVRNLDEFDEALQTEAGVIMLDNMTLEDMTEAVRRARGRGVLLEASGNVTLERVRSIAETGVDLISAGALTHSAPAVDLSLLIENV